MPRRHGFTLIELLIVVVILGILASLVVPKFRDSKGKAYAATIRADLHNLAVAQEAYYYQNSTYATSTTGLNLNNSSGVVLTINEASPAGWSATATHPQAYPLTCALFTGNAAAVTPASTEGVIGCQ